MCLMLKSLSQKTLSFPFVFVFSFLNTVILFPLQLQIPGMSWHQTHVKQINTFLHTLTSAAISLWAQLALHCGNSFGAGCYRRRTTLNQHHLFDSPTFTPVSMVTSVHPFHVSSSASLGNKLLLCIQHLTPVCHFVTLMECLAVGDHHSIWAAKTTGHELAMTSGWTFPTFLLLCNSINNHGYVVINSLYSKMQNSICWRPFLKDGVLGKEESIDFHYIVIKERPYSCSRKWKTNPYV